MRSAKSQLSNDGTPSPIRYFAERDDAVAETAVLSDDGATAALMWNVAGKSELAFLDTKSGKVRPGPKLPVDIAFAEEFSADSRMLVLVGAAADRTTDIYLVDVASGRVTRATESKHDGVDLASLVRPELVEYKSHDGLKLTGWLYRPRGASGPMPVVFNYHGGPEGQARPGLSPDTQALAASGIAVFAPNVRGSSGFGKAFMAMDDGAKRVEGVKDIEATTRRPRRARSRRGVSARFVPPYPPRQPKPVASWRGFFGERARTSVYGWSEFAFQTTT